MPRVWSGGQEDDAHSCSQQWRTLVHRLTGALSSIECEGILNIPKTVFIPMVFSGGQEVDNHSRGQQCRTWFLG